MRRSDYLYTFFAIFLTFSIVAQADTFGTGANQFTIDFVNISGATNPTSGYGIVNNDFRMGMFEVTNDQWTKFKAAYGTVIGYPSSAYTENPRFTSTNVPTNNVSWYEAAQFVNWLNTSTSHQAAYKFTGTQGTSGYTLGVWSASDAGYNASNPYRNSNAFYFLPTEDEWVKAAYWNGTSIQNYTAKVGTLYQGNGSNGGWNYYDGDYVNPYGPWAVGSGSQEVNGTYDMMGNVWEWMESPYDDENYSSSSSRGLRGGAYTSFYGYLRSSWGTYNLPPSFVTDAIGFRVASVPEPATLLVLALGGIMIRRRK